MSTQKIALKWRRHKKLYMILVITGVCILAGAIALYLFKGDAEQDLKTEMKIKEMNQTSKQLDSESDTLETTVDNLQLDQDIKMLRAQ